MLWVPKVNYAVVAMAIAVIIVMVKVADVENRSPLLWGCITFALVFCCTWFLGHALSSVVIAGVLAFASMTAVKMIRED